MQSSRTASIAGIAKRTNVRYLILLMIFIITTLNYADRATLSITGSAMRSEFGFDAIRMGSLFSEFSWADGLPHLPAGWLLDRFGARRMYGASIFLWSLFTLLQSSIGLAGSAGAAVIALFVLRFAMGMAEAPAFPANAKVVASWFPTAERGTASAIFNSAQYFAAVIFTPLMAWITHSFGWQNVYLVMGAAGIVLALTWLKVMKNPSDHPRVNKAELEHIENGGGLIHLQRKTAYADAVGPGTWFFVRQLMSNRMLLGVYLAQYCINVLTYFFLTWFPIYLVQARGMTILQAGLVAALPAGFGFSRCGVGGLLSGGRVRRRRSAPIAAQVPTFRGHCDADRDRLSRREDRVVQRRAGFRRPECLADGVQLPRDRERHQTGRTAPGLAVRLLSYFPGRLQITRLVRQAPETGYRRQVRHRCRK